MSLTKVEVAMINEVATPNTIRTYFSKVISFMIFIVLPICAVVWMEFFEGPQKIDNVIVLYSIVNIILTVIVQVMCFMFYLAFTVWGDDIVEKQKKKEKKKGDMFKGAANISKILRTTLFGRFKRLCLIIFIGLLAYVDHFILGAIMLSLMASGCVLRAISKEMIDDAIKKHFLPKEKVEELGE